MSEPTDEQVGVEAELAEWVAGKRSWCDQHHGLPNEIELTARADEATIRLLMVKLEALKAAGVTPQSQCTNDPECPIDGHTKVTRIAEWNKPPLDGQKITAGRAHVTPQPEEPPFPNGDNLEIISGWLVERGAYPLDYPAGAAYRAMPGSDAEPLINLNDVKGWPAPQPVYAVDKIADAIQQAITEQGLLACTRVWEAWAVGTMTEDDFEDAGDDPEIAADLARAVVAYLEGDAS